MILDKIAGNFDEHPHYKDLSHGARDLLKAAFRGLEDKTLVDYHAHVLGLGKGGTGCFIHPQMRSWISPMEYIKFNIYVNASDIKNLDHADQQYMERLDELMETMPGSWKMYLLALDGNYKKDGSVSKSKTKIYIPNRYVYNLSQHKPGYYAPCISVHPYRKDALVELETWAQQGVKMVKWIPNAMSIDPSDKRCDEFYKLMIKHNMVLLTHTGKDDTVRVIGAQKWGNPLLFRKPLDMGLKIIMAHCVSLGKGWDLDRKLTGLKSNFKLFMRLMDEKQYKHNLFGDISAIIQANRSNIALETILQRQDLHHRLINGTDYPLPAVNIIVMTGKLEKQGLITKEQREYLNEIYKHNPLLFDFAVKRTLRHKDGSKFSDSIFIENKNLGL
jgi:uncharacterized protein